MRIIAFFTALLAVSLPVRAIEVLTTIKPLGFIAAAITDGVSEPKVLLPTGASPHDFSQHQQCWAGGVGWPRAGRVYGQAAGQSFPCFGPDSG